MEYTENKIVPEARSARLCSIPANTTRKASLDELWELAKSGGPSLPRR